MRSRTRKRSRPKPEIEPIHLEELLGGAGMRGYLSVLEAPARVTADWTDGDPMSRWSARIDKVMDRFEQQEDVLRTVTQIIRRIQRGAVVLQNQSEAFGLSRTRGLKQWERRSQR